MTLFVLDAQDACCMAWLCACLSSTSGNWGGLMYATGTPEPPGSREVTTDVLSFCAQFIPESARFNVSTGNTQAALATLERIAKMNRSVMPEGKLVEPILVSAQLGGLLPPPAMSVLLGQTRDSRRGGDLCSVVLPWR